MPEALTNSRLKAFRACQRQHYYQYVLCRRPHRTAHALAFGTLMHALLEVYWCARKCGQTDPMESVMQEFDTHACGFDPFDQARAQVMMFGYASVWDQQRMTVLEVEKKFTLPLFNPRTLQSSPRWDLQGKLDAIVRLEDGRIAILEHKTSSADTAPGGDYRSALTLDSQVSTYFEGASILGYPADLCIYDVLVKPRINPLLATPEGKRRYTKEGTLNKAQREHDETPEEYRRRLVESFAENLSRYFVQIEVVRFDEDRRAHAWDVWQLQRQLSDQLEEIDTHGTLPPRNGDACHRYGSRCPYLPVCTRTARIEDDSLYRTAETANEELTENEESHG